MKENIKEGSKVTFNYTGKLESGMVFDSSEGREPLEFQVGSGMIIPGLEKQMLGMSKGQRKTITVGPNEAYGERREDLVREIPKGPVPEGMTLEEGTMIYIKTQQGQPIPALIREVKDETVVLDLNHPLAGEKLIFDIEIMEVV